MTTDTQNIFLFVFAAMMVALIIELRGVAKALQRRANSLEQPNQMEGEKGAKIS